jgi:probable rRNA maturation factor
LRVQRALSRKDAIHAPLAKHIRHWAGATMRTVEAEVAVRLVGEAEGRRLNRDYRGKDYATNILTFVYHEGEAMPALPEGGTLQGDLVVCVPVVVREAAEQGKAPEAHFAHLIVHGMLHLRGFDHDEEAEAQQMETAEREVLATLGYPDPYRGDEA